MKKSTGTTDKGNTPAKPGVKKPAPKKSTSKPKAEKPPKKPQGRPTKRTSAIEDEIIRRIGEGETLRSICRDEHMPSYGAVYDWAENDDKFSSRLAHARDKGEEAIVQECVEIADDGRNDWVEKFGKDGESLGYQINGEHVQRSKLRIETRLKLLAIWNPRKYGNRVNVDHGTQPGDPLAKLYEQMAGTPLRPDGDEGDK